MCFNNQSSKLDDTAACDLNLTNGTTYDFSNYPLNPGDLNQDGIVNAADYSIVKYNIDSSSDTDCSKTGDLNYDGMVNSFDINFLKKSLLLTDDEAVIDLNTITPTTATPTTIIPTLTNVDRSFTAQEYHTMKYWLYTPKGYNKDIKWPLIVFLHGGGEVGTNINKLIGNNTLPGVIKNGADFNAIIITPQYKGGSNAKYNGKNYIQSIKEDLIPHIIENYSIDTDRISVTGHSMGAATTVEMGFIYPKFFSSIVPVSLCSYNSSWINTLTKENIRVFHGTADASCKYTISEKFISKVNSAGGNAILTLIQNGPHVITKAVYIDNSAINWMIQQKLN